MLTDDPLPVLVQRHGRKWLDKHLDQDDTIVVAGADALHKASRAYSLFVNEIRELGDVDARRAGGWRRDRNTLTHRVSSPLPVD